MKKFRWWMVGLVLVAAPVWAAQGTGAATHAAPAASRPEPAQGPQMDYSDPRAAVRSFLLAVQSQGELGKKIDLHEALAIPAAHQTEIDTLLDLMTAQGRLQQAAVEKFKGDGEKLFGTSAETVAARLKAVDAAKMEINGETATLQMPTTADKTETVNLRRVAGQWKIDALSMFHLEGMSADTLAANMQLSGKIAEITKKMSDEILAGSFPTAGDAFQEYWTRCNHARQSLASGTASAGTAPAGK